MFDLSTLIEKQVLKRKCMLLRSLKISFESLMFERSASTSASWQFSFSSGTLTMFCRHLLECLLDGAAGLDGVSSSGSGATARSSSTDTQQSSGVPIAALVWSLIVSVLNSLNEFKSVREQMPSSSGPADTYETILIEWIFFSLRHHCLLVQIETLLNAREPSSSGNSNNNDQVPLIVRHFNSNAFLRDAEFVHDFLLYIK